MKTLIMWVSLTTLLCAGAIQAAEGSSETPSAVPTAGRSIREFVTPDGRIDINAVRASGYQGPLELKGFEAAIDPATHAPVVRPSVSSTAASDPDDIYWDNSMSPALAGVDGPVLGVSVYNGKLIVAGWFSIAGDQAVNNIAAWDGTDWSPLGSGIDGTVEALTVYDNKLIAGGNFTTAGAIGAKYIASWDGTAWSPLGTGVNSYVHVLTVYDNKLVAGGWFTTAGGTGANYIASWDGVAWSGLGSGIGGSGSEYPFLFALTVYDNKLIAGGIFATAGDVTAQNIASWDGTTWSPLGSGIGGSVKGLTVYDNKLIAGGYFTTAGGAAANGIASWDGTTWSPLGSGMGVTSYPYVLALTVYDNKLIAGGRFYSADGVTNNIASWDGSSWSPLGSGIYPHNLVEHVSALTVFDNKLIAGGDFTMAGGKGAYHLAAWDASDWSPLCQETNGEVFALLPYSGQLIAGGSFTAVHTTAANRIAAWNGSTWSALGVGVNRPVRTLVVYDEKLIVGGEFTIAGGIRANRIAAWDGAAWSPLGTGLTGSVFALAVYNGDLYAGGQFWGAGETEARNIARWDGRNWSAVGEGRERDVRAMVVYRGKLILIESFDHLYPEFSGQLSSWDGTRWENFPSPDYPPQPYWRTSVQSLAIYGDKLVAGGIHLFGFYECYGRGFVALWDGSKWSDLTDELGGWYCDIQVNALAASDAKLFVAGRFWPDIGDNYSAPIVAWDGSSWSTLGSGTGVDQDVYCLAPFSGRLVVGGNFTTAGGKVSAFVAQWTKHTPMSVNPVVQEITLDIRPGICPNPLFGSDLCSGKSVIPVAVQGSADFDVSDIDASSVTLCGVRALEWSLLDVSTPVDKTTDSCACSTDGPDGYPDLLLKFDQCAIESAIKPPPPPPIGTGVEVAKLAVGTGALTIPSTTLSEEPAKPPLVLTLYGMLEDGSPIIGYDCLELSDKVTPAIPPIDDPQQAGLRGNYPNPFNPTTTISYSVPAQTHVVIELFNIVGQRIRTLVDETKPSGVYEVVWNGTNDTGEPVSSGIYLYRLRAGDFIETKKMVLLK